MGHQILIFNGLGLIWFLGIKLIVTEDDVERGYRDAMFNMARLNRTAGSLMNTYGAHGATEVAGESFLSTDNF